MVEFQIRNRHRLRKKVIRKITAELNAIFSSQLNLEHLSVDSARIGEYDVYILEDELIAWLVDGKPFLTLHGLIRFKPERKFVTVDMGAIKYISNGADVMAPGVVGADPEIQVNEPVWVRDEKNLRPLVVGISLMTGPMMVSSKSEKAVRSLHYVGDKLWNIKL